jgi:formyltetrahydrofolate deformylase
METITSEVRADISAATSAGTTSISAAKAPASSSALTCCQTSRAEWVVLARYMQVLSDPMCRGVKRIGATAHYVTADLDEGPIIEQDAARVDRSRTVEDFTTLGRDTESQVLARAVKWHSEHRVLLNGHRTVIFK